MALNERQRRFVEEYLKDCNAAAAYRRAGYRVRTDKAAAAHAARLVANGSIAEAIAAGRARQAQAAGVEAAQVLRELALVGFSDLGQILDFSGDVLRLRPPASIPEAARRAIASVKVRRYTEGRGEDAREVEVTEFRLWPKTDALDRLARLLAMYPPLKVAPTDPTGTKPYAGPDLDEFRRLPLAERVRILREAVLLPPGDRAGPPPAG